MTWQIAIGIALLVVVVLWRLTKQLNPKPAGTASATSAPNRREPTMEELSSAPKGGLRGVGESDWQRNLWHRAEELIAACVEARGDDLMAARERLRQFVGEITASSEAFKAVDGLMSERVALMVRLGVEEIIEFANDALARQPEQQP